MQVALTGQATARQISELREKLLDLTGRNRLLNFKPVYQGKDGRLRVRGNLIQVRDELPEQVFQRMVTEARPMSFKPAKANDEDRLSEYEELEDGGHGAELPPAHQTDSFLQTTHSAAELDKRLYKIYLEARSVFEEQGYRVLYLALGLLEYCEDAPGVEKWLAPLVLVPVDLQRQGVGKPYRLVYTDDDIFPNVSLAARLRRDFNVALPEYPEVAEEMSVNDYFSQTEAEIRRKAGWRIHRDIYLGFFSFHKFVMWKDLDPENWPEGNAPQEHAVLNQTFTGSPGVAASDGNSPFDEDRIDELLPASRIFHLLDADPSQIAVIEDIKSGRNLVVQGPPGTGKSQTIANAIAELLAMGKTVLFVSEKMAALEVVKARLDNCGLGSFCLELHSHKASKRQVLAQLKEAMEFKPHKEADTEEQIEALEERKAELNAYAEALRSPVGESGLSTFTLYGMLEAAQSKLDALGQADLLHKQDDLALLDAASLKKAREALAALAVSLKAVHPVLRHPWRGLRPPGFKLDQEEVVSLLMQSAEELAKLLALLRELESGWGVSQPESLGAVLTALEACSLLREYPDADERLLTAALWNQPPAEATALLAQLDACRELLGRVTAIFKAEALEGPVATVLAAYEKHYRSFFSRLFNAEFRAARRQALAWSAGPNRKKADQVLAELQLLDQAISARNDLRGQARTGVELFGSAWRDEHSDPQLLRRLADWLARYRQGIVDGCLAYSSSQALRQGRAGTIAGHARQIDERRQALESKLAELRRRLLAAEDQFGPGLVDLQERLAALLGSSQQMSEWARYVADRDRCLETAAREAWLSFEQAAALPEAIGPAFEKSLALALLRRAFHDRPVLMNFTADCHEELVAEFQQLDKAVLLANRARLCQRLHRRRAEAQEPLVKAARLVKHEINKGRAHKPIRRLIREAGELVQALKPCMMMSPLSVAQYLAPDSLRFDVVIFDEASQVRPEDALGAIARAGQVVVVGDSRQMPPTSFFDRAEREDAEQFEDDDFVEPEPRAGEHESILKLCELSFEERSLNWHYRSRHETLISLANDRFYGGRLRIFPSNSDASDEIGLRLVSTAGSAYEPGKGENCGEARILAEAAREHFLNTPELSLGIGAFGIRQQSSIQLALDQLIRETHDYDFEAWLRSGPQGRNEPCFVKNLETIQGDERDAIFISVGYGKDAEGKLNQNFGPLNKTGGERRLNVMITRARVQCRVFCNFTADDLRIEANSAEGLRCLRDFLHYAQTGRLERHEFAGRAADSPFEQAVEAFLLQNNFTVLRQYSSGTYIIDLVVLHRGFGTRLAGVECDGASYHSCYNARERDRLREEILRGRGWEIVRVWSTEWFRQPRNAKERLLSQLEELERRQSNARAAAAGMATGS